MFSSARTRRALRPGWYVSRHPGGRRSAIPLWLGIDVGGTKVALGLGDETGSLRARRRRPTEPSGNGTVDLARIVEDAHQLLAEARIAPAELSGVGVSLPGPLDREGGRILHPPNLPGWGTVQVREPFAAAFGRPVFLENDANAAALAEWRFGAGRGFADLVYLTMSTGVGGGLILSGRLHRGLASSAGEFGHAPIVWEGEPCVCGMRGCLEAYVGGAAWTRRLRREVPAASRVAELAGGSDQVTPKHVVSAAREGDPFALAEFERFNDYLARAIVQIAFALAPQVVVLGTIAAAAGEALCLAPVRRRVAARAWSPVAETMQILPAKLGDELPYLAGIGAAVEGAREA